MEAAEQETVLGAQVVLTANKSNRKEGSDMGEKTIRKEKKKPKKKKD